MGFFDRVKGTVEEAGKNITTAASDNIEIVKCNSAIRTCETKIRDTYTEIGERYYNSTEEMSRADFDDLFEKIQFQQNEITGLKKKLQDLKGVEICKSCGREVARNSKFCQWCGAPNEPEKTWNQEMSCPNCHAPLTGAETFCGECGTKIEWPEQAEEIEKPLTCFACGAEIKETDLFCQNCGTPVKQAETVTDAAETEESVEDAE